MKLFYCPYCQDVVRLLVARRRCCECGASWGSYRDSLNAVICGAAIPLEIDWQSLLRALRRREMDVEGSISFDAFIIPEDCATVKREM